MKKVITAALALVMAAVICSAAVFADSKPKAPVKIWVNIVKHDTVMCKWDKVEGAKSYMVYKMNKNGEYRKVREFEKTDITISKLKANTEYTYGISAISKSGTESRITAVTFTTPEKWYYSLSENSDMLERCHYDGSGRQTFDIIGKIIDSEEERSSYSLSRVEQQDGYVYVSLSCNGMLDDTWYSFYRMKNSGRDIEPVSGCRESGVERYYYSPDKVFYGCDTAFNGGEAACLMHSEVWMSFMHDGKMKKAVILDKHMTNISSFVHDENYVYFFASPYHDLDHACEDDMKQLDKFVSLYRVSLADPTEEQLKSGVQLGELYAKLDYNFSDDNITPLGCRDGYLYYYTLEEKESRHDLRYTFYRIALDKENAFVIDGKTAQAENLGSENMYRIDCVEMKNDKIWFFGYKNSEKLNDSKYSIYSIDISAKTPVIERFLTVTCNFEQNDYAFGKPSESKLYEITDDYIYFRRNGKCIRVDIAKKTVKRRKTPFAWK